jgi:ATP-dependent DNA helicase RecG
MSEARDRSALELLQELRELSEHERIEAKRGTSISHSVMETVCAFANEPHLGGGWLLLGLEEDDSRLFRDFRVVGISDSDKLQNDLQSQCRSVFNTLNVTETLAASKHLGRLRDLGLLEKRGKSTATYYIPGPKFLPGSTPALSAGPGRLPADLEALSPELEGLPSDLTRMISALSSDLSRELTHKIPEYRRSMGKRGDAVVIRQIVLELCALREWRDDELALMIGRTAKYIRQNYLAPMVAEGVLQRTHPENIHHPQQAYRAANS